MKARTEAEARREIVSICRRMYDKGFVAAADGNASVRIGGGLIVATPTGAHKGMLDERDLVVCDSTGKVIRGTQPPSSEIRMHLLMYERRPDVQAVLHAHPPITIAFSIVGVGLAECVLPESVFSLGNVGQVGYATPTTEDVPQAVSQYADDYNVMILDRHGSLTVGKDLDQAYCRLEALEHTARITYLARQLGPVSPLPEQEVIRLQQIAVGLGVSTGDRYTGCRECNICNRATPSGPRQAQQSLSEEQTIEVIAERVARLFEK